MQSNPLGDTIDRAERGVESDFFMSIRALTLWPEDWRIPLNLALQLKHIKIHIVNLIVVDVAPPFHINRLEVE